MKVCVTLPTRFEPQPWHRDVADLFRAWLAADPDSPYELVDEAEDGALILFMELTMRQDGAYLEALVDEPLRQAHPNRFFTYNVHWRPIGFLPGAYTGLTRATFEPERHVPWGFLFLANGRVHDATVPPPTERWLFSFRGAGSHPLRERILNLHIPPGVSASVKRIDRWFDHTKDEQTSYVEELQRSAFVLCPRGTGPSSHRLFETMAVGRCPVIISDEWVPLAGIDWDRCSVRIPESDVASIPARLLERRDDATELGRRARQEWERRFSKTVGPRALLDQCRAIIASRPAGWDERNAVRSWLDPDRLSRLKDVPEPSALRRIARKIEA